MHARTVKQHCTGQHLQAGPTVLQQLHPAGPEGLGSYPLRKSDAGIQPSLDTKLFHHTVLSGYYEVGVSDHLIMSKYWTQSLS